MRYVADGEETRVDTELHLTSERIEELLTQEVVSSESRLVLVVKKPDYLGNSRWEFKLDDRTIEANVLDEEWLARFRAGAVTLHPHDALDATVLSQLHRGFEGNVVSTHHYVLKVHQVVRQRLPDQQTLF